MTRPASEGWLVIGVYSALRAIRQERTRRERLAQAHQGLQL